MRIKNRFISAGFKLIYLAGALYGVLLQLFAPGAQIWSVLSFFTMQSNLFCIALTLVLLSCDLSDIDYRQNRVYAAVRFCATVSILLTFTLYHAILEPWLCAEYPAYFHRLSLLDTLLHNYTPVMLLLDYLLFDEKGLFRWWHVLLSTAVPVFYAVYTAVYSATGGVFIAFDGVRRAPYFFLDYPALGPGRSVLWGAGILVCTWILAFALTALDRGLSRLWKAYRLRNLREPVSASKDVE